MINWIKGHLKVFDCAGASGDVSVCNLGSGHKKKKPLIQIHKHFKINLKHESLSDGLLCVSHY